MREKKVTRTIKTSFIKTSASETEVAYPGIALSSLIPIMEMGGFTIESSREEDVVYGCTEKEFLAIAKPVK